MWPTVALGFFCVLNVTLSVYSVLLAISAARRAEAGVELPLKRLRSIESRTELLENSAAEQLATLSDLANRVKMMKVRAAVTHTDPKTPASSQGEPDPYKNPDEWRTMMTRRMAEAKHGVKR